MPRVMPFESKLPSKFQQPHFARRRRVLRDTLSRFDTQPKRFWYHSLAEANHKRWLAGAAAPTRCVRVLKGDWGDITGELAKKTGQIYAVLNMANAYVPGGGYLEGWAAQEENMFRRTDCHYFVFDEEMNVTKTKYTKEMTKLINGENGRVYLKKLPRVCIKGSEPRYRLLDERDYFLFYELRSAADDLRYLTTFNETSMRRKIRAQLDTLRDNNIRHVVLSAFGCGAFRNPAEQVARIYREELEKTPDYFDEVVFAIYSRGHGKDNFTPFYAQLHNLPLSKPVPLAANNGSFDMLGELRHEIESTYWNNKGYVCAFFSCLKKTPKGIVEMRAVLNNGSDAATQFRALQAIAQDRLEHPPTFTTRDTSVRDLYSRIVQMDAPQCGAAMSLT